MTPAPVFWLVDTNLGVLFLRPNVGPWNFGVEISLKHLNDPDGLIAAIREWQLLHAASEATKISAEPQEAPSAADLATFQRIVTFKEEA